MILFTRVRYLSMDRNEIFQGFFRVGQHIYF
jgi:hypothetical protein